jgi:Mn2+/Fe2+ NRAMP family transporter
MVQELTVRLGLYTGRGHGELIRERFGPYWACVSIAGLMAATAGSLITEFTGVAGVGELYGAPRTIVLLLAASALMGIVATGSYKRVERTVLFIGLFELSFFVVAWVAHPGLAALTRDAVDLPLGDRDFLLMAAAIVGATFNPWMIFYQQSATIDKALRPDDLTHARWDTGVGAVLTQCLTGAILIAAAAALAGATAPSNLSSVGEISSALTPVLGETAGRAAFSAGVLGASMVAAIVSSLALAWGIGEVAGHRRSLELRPFEARWFYSLYSMSVVASASAVWLSSNLVWLNITAQILNAFLMPLVIGFLVALAVTTLPEPYRLRRGYLLTIAGVSAVVSAIGVFGGLQALR